MDNIFSHKDIIYTVYQESSFSKAAEKLYISQPSLSVIVKKVEENIGTPIFDRSYKPIRLTTAGEAYIRAVSEINKIESSFEEFVSSVDSLAAGSLRIGSNQLLSSFVLPKYIAEFAKLYPGIKLSLMDASSPGLDSALLRGDLDMIIDNREIENDQFENVVITEEHMLLAIPSSFECNRDLEKYSMTFDEIANQKELPDRETVPLELLEDVPFILMTKDNETRERTEMIFQSANFAPKVLLEVDRLVTLYNFLQTETAASVISDTLLRHVAKVSGGTQKLLFYRLPHRYESRNIVVSYKRNMVVSRAMKEFTELFKSAY